VKDRLVTFVKLLISLGLIAYVVTRPAILEADWKQILAGLRLWPFLVGLGVYFVAISLNVLKWRVLLRSLGIQVSFMGLLRHNLVGLFFANLPLSMIGGDIARGWDLARHTAGQGAAVAVSVVVDRLVGLAAFLIASIVGLAYAVVVLGRPDLAWLLSTIGLVLLGFALAFSMLLSHRLRGLVERIFDWGPLGRFRPLYHRLSEAVQVYRTHSGILGIALSLGLATVVATCLVNYLAAVTVNADVPLRWAFVLTPMTPFALYIPSIASGLGVNQVVFVALYHSLAGLIAQASALALSLVMQVIIYTASLPGAVLWWRRRESRKAQRNAAVLPPASDQRSG
jgi:uncharacterized protein (TIRG00374 family)